MPRNIVLCAKCTWRVTIERRPLVILERFGGLGDLVCLLSSVNSLRAKHRSCWMVIICPPGTSPLAASAKLADAASDANSFFHWFITRNVWRPIKYRPLLPDEYRPARPQRLHLSEEFAAALNVTADPQTVHISATSPARKAVARRLAHANSDGRKIVVIHPGPTWPVREWPLSSWIQLVDMITAVLPVIVIQIGDDYDYLSGTRRPLHIAGAVNWVNQLTLMEMVALLERTAAFIGIDSGPLHIATVLGVPTIGLFGPIDARLRVHPRACTIVITGTADCLGCHHAASGPIHWRSGCPNEILCMRSIVPDRVFSAVRTLITERPEPSPKDADGRSTQII
jgi:ADP-heptose:LPS heptosyltransferase